MDSLSTTTNTNNNLNNDVHSSIIPDNGVNDLDEYSRENNALNLNRAYNSNNSNINHRGFRNGSGERRRAGRLQHHYHNNNRNENSIDHNHQDRSQDRRASNTNRSDRFRDRDDRGSRTRGYGGRGGNGRPRDLRRAREQPPPERLNTLVIKDADNEFLRMLKQSAAQSQTEEKNVKLNRDEIDDIVDNHRQEQQQRRHQRQFVNMQPSRVPKPVDGDHQHKACPVCLMDSPSLTGELVQAITSCEHIYCFECALRLVFITNKEDCPICRQTLKMVLLTRVESIDESKEIRDFLALSNAEIGGALKQDKFKRIDKMIYYDCRNESMEIFELAKRLLWFNCPSCTHLIPPYSFKMTNKSQTAYDSIARHLLVYSVF